MFYQKKEYSGAHITQSITIDIPASARAQLVTAIARVSALPAANGAGGMRLALTTQNGGLPHCSDAVAVGSDGSLAASCTILTQTQSQFGTAVTLRLSPIGTGVQPATIDLSLIVAAQEDPE